MASLRDENILASLRKIVSEANKAGIPVHDIVFHLDKEIQLNGVTRWTRLRTWVPCILPCLLVVFLLHVPFVQLWNGSFCVFPTPMVMVGMIQPLANCSICQGLTEAPRLVNLSRKDFALHHAHSSRPIVVVGAALNWSATQELSYEYFQSLYQRYPDAIQNDMAKGQFFSYSSNIRNLKDLFELSSERAAMTHERWYIGWYVHNGSCSHSPQWDTVSCTMQVY